MCWWLSHCDHLYFSKKQTNHNLFLNRVFVFNTDFNAAACFCLLIAQIPSMGQTILRAPRWLSPVILETITVKKKSTSEVLLRAGGRWADVGQQARKPPSTGRVTPLIMLLFSLSRNKMLFTTSSTSAHRHTHHTQLYRANPDTTGRIVCRPEGRTESISVMSLTLDWDHANWSHSVDSSPVCGVTLPLTLGRFPCIQELNTNTVMWSKRTCLTKTAATDLRSGPGGSGTSCSWLFQDRSSPSDPCQSSPLWGSRCSHGSDHKTTPELIESPKRRQIPSLFRRPRSDCRILFFMLTAGQAAVTKVTS